MQMRHFFLLVTVLVAVTCTSTTFARKWTDTTGKHTVEAEFLELKDGVVHLKKENGQIISLPLDTLSETDQKYIDRKINPPAAKKSKRPPQTTWYSAGLGWKELAKITKSRGICLWSFSHDAERYQKILSRSQPGSTVVLLFTLDSVDKSIPEEYKDLLPLPWSEIETALKEGKTVERTGKA